MGKQDITACGPKKQKARSRGPQACYPLWLWAVVKLGHSSAQLLTYMATMTRSKKLFQPVPAEQKLFLYHLRVQGGAPPGAESCKVLFSQLLTANPGHGPVSALLWRSESFSHLECVTTLGCMQQHKAGQVLKHHHPAGVRQYFLDCLGKQSCSRRSDLAPLPSLYGFLPALFSFTMWALLQILNDSVPKYSYKISSPRLTYFPKPVTTL